MKQEYFFKYRKYIFYIRLYSDRYLTDIDLFYLEVRAQTVSVNLDGESKSINNVTAIRNK